MADMSFNDKRIIFFYYLTEIYMQGICLFFNGHRNQKLKQIIYVDLSIQNLMRIHHHHPSIYKYINALQDIQIKINTKNYKCS